MTSYHSYRESFDSYYPDEAYYDDIYEELLDEYEEIDRQYGTADEDEEESEDLTEVLRDIMHESYQDASAEEIQEAFDHMLSQMSPMEGFNFQKALKQIGKAGKTVLSDPTVGQIARTALPIAGTAIGTIYGGPVGAALGGKLGSLAGSAFTGGQPPATPHTPVTTSPQRSPQMPAQQAQQGSAAASQLLQLTQDPNVLKSLAALALGQNGAQSVSAGSSGQQIPVGAFVNLLSQLTTQAAADAESLSVGMDGATDYLRGPDGMYRVDPSNPEERALALYETLTYSEYAEDVPADKAWPKFFPFKAGKQLTVEYDHIINIDLGTASVLKRTPTILELKLDIKKQKKFGQEIPKTQATIRIEYVREGKGNRAKAVVNGSTFEDNDVKISSSGNKRHIHMSVAIMGVRVGRITLEREDSDEATLTFQVGSDSHTLILKD